MYGASTVLQAPVLIMNLCRDGADRPVSFNYDQGRLGCLTELALTWRMKHLPRHHLKRWYVSTLEYSIEELGEVCRKLQRRERMPCLADLLRELRVGREAAPAWQQSVGCAKCQDGYISKQDPQGRWIAIQCCAT